MDFLLVVGTLFFSFVASATVCPANLICIGRGTLNEVFIYSDGTPGTLKIYGDYRRYDRETGGSVVPAKNFRDHDLRLLRQYLEDQRRGIDTGFEIADAHGVDLSDGRFAIRFPTVPLGKPVSALSHDVSIQADYRKRLARFEEYLATHRQGQLDRWTLENSDRQDPVLALGFLPFRVTVTVDRGTSSTSTLIKADGVITWDSRQILVDPN